LFATEFKTSFEEMPAYFSTLFGSIQVMQEAIVQKMLEIRPPDIASPVS